MYFDVFLILLLSILCSLFTHIGFMRLFKSGSVYTPAFLIFNITVAGATFLYSYKINSLTNEHIAIIYLFINSFLAVYTLLLVGIVNDSPTLAIVKAIMSKEPDGFTQQHLQQFIKRHPFVSTRMETLSESKGIMRRENSLLLTSRIKPIISLIKIYQKLANNNRERG